MAKDLVFEIGCEEIPARFVPQAADDLKQRIQKQLDDLGIVYRSLECLSTYRRLTIYIHHMADRIPTQTKTIKGPPLSVGKKDGAYTPAAIGFAKKCGLSGPENLQEHSIDGQPYLVAITQEGGGTIIDTLPKLLETAVSQVALPIAMRWADEPTPFIRPLQWILCLYGSTVVPVTCFGISAGQTSYGHRFLTTNTTPDRSIWGKSLRITSAAQYLNILRDKGKVIADPQERQASIVKQLNTYKAYPSADLLSELLYLTEYPTVLTGTFDKSFLTIPQEVLMDCMISHQKYVPILKGKTLTNTFAIVAENVTAKSKANIIKGNERVLRARLNDMAFFWEEDQKTSLKDNINKLKNVTYQKNCGSMYDKVLRIKAIASDLAPTLGAKKHLRDIQTTAELCKADLVTQMVSEASDLQGTMGRLYAEKEGINTSISQGIEDHYKPRFADDSLPDSTTGIIVGLADRLDSIVTSFENGYNPSGSQDPLGIRRALLSIFKVALDQQQFPINLEEWIDMAYTHSAKGSSSRDKVISFTQQRLRGYLIDELNIDYDCVDAVLDSSTTALLPAVACAKALQKKQASLKQLSETAVRIGRLAQKASTDTVQPALFNAKEENVAWSTYQSVNKSLKTVSIMKDTRKYMQTLELLVPVMTSYFEAILVMDKDAKIKANRLAFLSQLHHTLSHTINFEKLVF